MAENYVPDGSVTVHNADSVIRLLRDAKLPVSKCWNQLGCELGVPLEERRKLRQVAEASSYDYWLALEECIEWWLRNNTELATWSQLLVAVEKVDRRAASAIRQQLGFQIETVPHNVTATDKKRTLGPGATNATTATNANDVSSRQPVGSSWRYTPFKLLLLTTVFIIVHYHAGLLLAGVVVTIVVLIMFILQCGRRHSRHHQESVKKLVSVKTDFKVSSKNKTSDPHIENRIWIAGETGDYVVKKCIEKLDMLREAQVFPDDKNFMERLAFVMSRNGNASFVLHNDGGIWQVSGYAFDDTKNELEHIRLPRKYQKLQDMLGIKDWRQVSRTDLEKPMYSALAARLYLSNFAEAIPPSFNIAKQQNYWWRFYMRRHEARSYMQESDYMNAVQVMNH